MGIFIFVFILQLGLYCGLEVPLWLAGVCIFTSACLFDLTKDGDMTASGSPVLEIATRVKNNIFDCLRGKGSSTSDSESCRLSGIKGAALISSSLLQLKKQLEAR